VKVSGGLKFKLSHYLEEQGISLSSRQKIIVDSYTLDTTSAKYIEYSLLNDRIERMHYLDQLSRRKHNYNDSIYIDEIQMYVSTKRAIKTVDSLNSIALKDLFLHKNLAEHEINNYKFSTLILHLDEAFFELQWFLVDMLLKGNLDPCDFAMSSDRAHCKVGLCPQFFTPSSNLDADSKSQCMDREKIFANREKIGLSNYYVKPSFYYYISPTSPFKKSFSS
jgi:hypothetical protein